MRMTKGDIAYQVIIFVTVSILLLIAIFPLVYVTGLSFTSEKEWISSGGKVIIPKAPSLEGYKMVLRQKATFGQAFLISVLRTLIGTAVTLFFSMCTGYVLSRKDIPFKTAMLVMVLITILFNGGLIPTFLVVVNLKLYNTLWALIIPGLVDSWSVLVFRQFFANIPESIEESARIDGASEVEIMWQIAVPLSKAVIAALTLFMAVGHWNAWFDAAVYIQDDWLKPLQLLLRNLFINANVGYDMQSGGAAFDVNTRVTPLSMRMCITILGTLPILCVYPFLQKYFTKGVYIGAVKG